MSKYIDADKLTSKIKGIIAEVKDKGQPDRNHYQQFNADYICKILNAYKGRRAWVLKKANEAVPKEEPKPNPERERYYMNEININDYINLEK